MRFKPIRRNNDFQRAYRKGKNTVHPHVVVYINRNRVGHTRVGITASKKVGNAVTRNRARRVIQSALRQVLPQNAGPFDIVLVARGQTAALKSYRLEGTLEKILKKHGIKCKERAPANPRNPVPQKRE